MGYQFNPFTSTLDIVPATVNVSAVPTGTQSSTSVVTAATTTYVTALTTTVTVTTSCSIYATAVADLKATTAACIAQSRITINAVAGQVLSLSLLNTTDHYTAAAEMLSASVGPGTYTVNYQINRLSGTGTVNFFQGTLFAEGMQGGQTNGITQLTGALQAGPGSGSQVLSGVLPVANGGTHLSSTTINQLLYSSANNVIAGLATANTAALVASSTGVPSFASGATANRLLRTNGTTVSFAQAALTTDVTGTLPLANGGTGATAFANQRIPFSNGTNFVADAQFIYDTTNTRFYVGQAGGTGRLNGTVSSGSDLAGNFYSQGTNNCLQAQNQSANTISLVNAGGAGGAIVNFEYSRGTLVARTQSKSGDVASTLNTQGYTGAGFATGVTTSITTVLSEDTTATNQGGELAFNTAPNGTTAVVERLRIKNSGETTLVNSHLKSTQTTAPTILVSANAGTGGSASLANATDVAGAITITTGTLGISAGAYATITFNKVYGVAPIVVLTPASSTLSTSVYVTSTTSGFTVNFALAGSISSTYVLNYYVIETQ